MPDHHGLLRRAFSLTELLVAITIIAILVALLLPAIQAGREAARRAQCGNHMKQLGLACANYESLHGCFPPSSYFNVGDEPEFDRKHWRNWAIAILPHLELESLYGSFVLVDSAGADVPINDSRNAGPRGTELPAMKCPSDPYNQVKFSSVSAVEGGNWARGNYAANASLGAYALAHFNGLTTAYSAAGADSPLSKSRYHRGVMGSNLATGVSEVHDGTSNTILLGEVRAGLTKHDRRGTWALGDPGASSLWAHGLAHANGPNDCAPLGDDILDSSTVIAEVGSSLQSQCMICSANLNAEGGTRSCHAGGVFVTMVDGSVRFVSNFVEKTTSPWIWGQTISPSRFLCWQRLCASQDGLAIDGAKF